MQRGASGSLYPHSDPRGKWQTPSLQHAPAQLIGTARKHNVATILAVQDFNQAVRDYGEKSANILKASCVTRPCGMTGNEKTAKDIENLLGEKKEAQELFEVISEEYKEDFSI